jgi:peptidoglycan hydrolase-like protein with peptidoglycan-binding domain
MKRALFLVMMLCLATLARADDQTQAVQQALKDQGFYYGTVDGQPGPETDAAIKRYQIRQGLQVTGLLDAETLTSLNLGGGASGATTPPPPPPSDDSAQTPPPPPPDDTTQAPPAPAATPTPDVVQSDHDFLKAVPPSAATPAPPDEVQAPPPPEESVQPPPPGPPQAQPVPKAYAVETLPGDYSKFFRKTPYETAPPVVQRSTVQRAQARLGREGFYRGYADGELSKGLSHALSNYQREDGLRDTGRLDMATLADMGLLPRDQGAPPPPGPYMQPFYGDRPVYQGVWVH